MWRRSWLSREVLLFTAFSGVANAYAAALWFNPAAGLWVGAFTVMLGLAGVTATAYLYRVPARPSWNTPLTLLQFLATTGLLGSAFALAIGAGDAVALRVGTVAFAAVQMALIGGGFLRLIASDSIELRGTARLLSTALAAPFFIRGSLLVAGGFLPLAGSSPLLAAASLVLLLAGELLGRYLFFVSVVPKHMTTPYLAIGSEAA
jgi:DMSO reductase anchor subunit